jgi:hypothetical protein
MLKMPQSGAKVMLLDPRAPHTPFEPEGPQFRQVEGGILLHGAHVARETLPTVGPDPRISIEFVVDAGEAEERAGMARAQAERVVGPAAGAAPGRPRVRSQAGRAAVSGSTKSSKQGQVVFDVQADGEPTGSGRGSSEGADYEDQEGDRPAQPALGMEEGQVTVERVSGGPDGAATERDSYPIALDAIHGISSGVRNFDSLRVSHRTPLRDLPPLPVINPDGLLVENAAGETTASAPPRSTEATPKRARQTQAVGDGEAEDDDEEEYEYEYYYEEDEGGEEQDREEDEPHPLYSNILTEPDDEAPELPMVDSPTGTGNDDNYGENDYGETEDV